MSTSPRHFFLILALVTAATFRVEAKTEGPIAGYVHTGWTQTDGAPAEVRGIVQDED